MNENFDERAVRRTRGRFASQPSAQPLADEPSHMDVLEDVGAVDGAAGLWQYLRHNDAEVRAEATAHPALTHGQLVAASEDSDWIVRFAAAERASRSVAKNLRSDPDPRVRTALRHRLSRSRVPTT